MTTQISKIFYDGQKFTNLGDHFTSLESAHGSHREYANQVTFEEVENTDKPYLHLMEFRNDEHYNDLYFFYSNEARFALQFQR